MNTLRKPFFITALILILLVVLTEVGGVDLLRKPVAGGVASFEELIPATGDLRDAYKELDPGELQNILNQTNPPGLAIRYLALLDGLLLLTVALMALSLVIPLNVHVRVQGITMLIFSLLLIIGAIVLIIIAFLLVILMISLLLAVPFGTLAYLAIYGFFNRAGASAILGLLMALKIGFVICLTLAQQRFLENKSLVLLILTSLLGNIVIAFLHGLPPIILVSITDGIAAIVVAILAVIWAIVLLVSSVISVVRALRVDRG